MQNYQLKIDQLRKNVRISKDLCDDLQMLVNLAEKAKDSQQNKADRFYLSHSKFNKNYEAFLQMNYTEQLHFISIKIEQIEAIDHLSPKGELPVQCQMQIQIREETALLARWKKRIGTVLYKFQRGWLQLSVHKYGKSADVSYRFNLMISKISKKCSNIDLKRCFGLQTYDYRRFLISLPVAAHCDNIHNKILEAKAKIKRQRQRSIERINQVDQQTNKFYIIKEAIEISDISLIKMHKEDQDRSNDSLPLEFPYSREQEVFYTVTKEQYQLYDQKIEEKNQFEPIHQNQSKINYYLKEEEIAQIQTEAGYKLISNFSHGRILLNQTKNKKICRIKAYLIMSKESDAQLLMESYLRMQMWNQHIKQFKVHSRISESIYIVCIKLAKLSFLSFPRYTYALVTAYYQNDNLYVSIKSLIENQNPPISDHTWMYFSQIIQFKRCNDDLDQYLMTIVSEFDFKGFTSDKESQNMGLTLIEPIKKFINYRIMTHSTQTRFNLFQKVQNPEVSSLKNSSSSREEKSIDLLKHQQ